MNNKDIKHLPNLRVYYIEAYITKEIAMEKLENDIYKKIE